MKNGGQQKCLDKAMKLIEEINPNQEALCYKMKSSCAGLHKLRARLRP